MTKLNVDTSAFTSAENSKAGRRERRLSRRLGSRHDLIVTEGVVDAETVRIALEIKGLDGGLVIMVETSDGDDWTQVNPELLKEGFVAILRRESKLERAAARYGLPAEVLLAALADAVVDVSDPSVGLPESELEALRAAGISLAGSPTDPSGAGQVARGIARSQQFRDDALTVAEAAKELKVSDGRVRQLIAAGSVMSIPNGDGGHLLPPWQFAQGRLLPGLEKLAEVADGLHPLTLAGFMARPDVDLEVDGDPVSPIEWLLAGGDPTVVADLVAGLRVPA